VNGGEGDERPGAEADDEDGDVVPGVVTRGEPTLLLPKTSSMLVGADAWVRPMLCAMAAGGALVLQGNAVACRSTVLRLAYLGVTNVFALLRLLPMSCRDKDAKSLVLRHQLSVLQRQVGPDRVRFTPAPADGDLPGLRQDQPDRGTLAAAQFPADRVSQLVAGPGGQLIEVGDQPVACPGSIRGHPGNGSTPSDSVRRAQPVHPDRGDLQRIR
jgi:hypothetical protein